LKLKDAPAVAYSGKKGLSNGCKLGWLPQRSLLLVIDKLTARQYKSNPGITRDGCSNLARNYV
jgi:hypothetical protein